MNNRKGSQTSAPGAMKVLFLESHGLRSPLTAIRWACGRLRKESTGILNPEQRRLVHQIYTHAKKLTAALESMLVLAKIEDHLFAFTKQELCVQDVLPAVLEKFGNQRGIHWQTSAPHLHFVTNRELLETILRDLCAVFSETTDEHERTVFIDVQARDHQLVILFRSSLPLPILQEETLEKADQALRMIGGVQGLMLSMANEFARHLHGTVEMEDVVTGEFIEDGTVDLAEGDADEHRVVLRLPLRTRIVNGPCNVRERVRS